MSIWALTYQQDHTVPLVLPLPRAGSVRRQRWVPGARTPVTFLSARRSVDDRIRGLHAGGDDYLTKPFSFDELLARLMALVRRASRTAEPKTLAVADLSLDLLSRDVVRGGRRVELSPRGFSLLEYLMRNPGRVLPKTAILSHVWSYAFDPRTNLVDILVSRPREKVDRDFEAASRTPSSPVR